MKAIVYTFPNFKGEIFRKLKTITLLDCFTPRRALGQVIRHLEYHEYCIEVVIPSGMKFLDPETSHLQTEKYEDDVR